MPLTPYYSHAGITIYHGDCLEILPHWARNQRFVSRSTIHRSVDVDVIITDPPYGVGLGVDNNQNGDSSHLHKAGYCTYEDTYENFVDGIVPRLNLALQICPRAAIFTGPHIHEQAKPNAIGGIWHPAATGRTAWGSKNFLPILFYGVPPNAGQHRPTVLRSVEGCERSDHPCPKPQCWLNWLVGLASAEGELILDPFCGSGTTLRAAKDLGRSAIGIEIEEKYCEIAARRLSQEVLDFSGASI